MKRALIVAEYPEASMKAIVRVLERLDFEVSVFDGGMVTRLLSHMRGALRCIQLLALARDVMYLAKIICDVRAERLVTRKGFDVVVGAWGGCSRSLHTARASGAIAILSLVNAHPDEHNARLRVAGAPSRSGEYVPEWFARRVKREIAAAHLVVVPSEALARDLEYRGIPKPRIVVARYGSSVRQQTGQRRRTFDLPLRVLFVGQISYRKGINVLADLANRYNDRITIDLVGPVVSRRLLKDVPSNVHYLGVMPNGELVNKYRSTDLFVFPSFEDTFGLVVADALAAGCATFVSVHTGAAELLRGHEDLLFDPDSPETLWTAIERILDDETYLEELREVSESIAPALSWEHFESAVTTAITGAMYKGEGKPNAG